MKNNNLKPLLQFYVSLNSKQPFLHTPFTCYTMYWHFLLYTVIFLRECSLDESVEEVDNIYNNIFKAAHDTIHENLTDKENELVQFEANTDNVIRSNNISEDQDMEEYSNDTLNYTVPWNIFIAMLMQISLVQLTTIKENINSIYNLGNFEIMSVNTVFNNSEEDFESLILKKYKSTTNTEINHNDKDFMLNFTDVAISFINKILSFNLNLVKGMMETPTTWYHQTLRDKILRQQGKNSSNYIRFRVCKVLSICRDKTKYSDYVIEWIRHVFALAKPELAHFFRSAPEVINMHSDFIGTNGKFRQTLKYINDSPETVQRDTLDFLDEAVVKRQEIYDKVPQALRPGAVAITQLFEIIDDFYELNTENVAELEDISDILSMWKYQSINADYVLESIVKNMKVNMARLPKTDKQNIENIWYQITVL